MPTPVRAKFKCDYRRDAYVALSPVYSGSEENKAFFAATPGGQILLHVVNESAAVQFVEGQEYYVDFTPAEK